MSVSAISQTVGIRSRLSFGIILMGTSATGCQDLPRDDGQIWSCFGLTTEDVAGGAEVDTNLYFGGCSPADPGLQIRSSSFHC